MPPNRSKLIQMAQNGSKLFEIALNGFKWLPIAPNSFQIIKMASIGRNFLPGQGLNTFSVHDNTFKYLQTIPYTKKSCHVEYRVILPYMMTYALSFNLPASNRITMHLIPYISSYQHACDACCINRPVQYSREMQTLKKC